MEIHRKNEDDGDIAEEGDGQLTIDVYQTPTAIVVESPIAGVTADDLDINVTSDSVTIKGRRERVSEASGEDYLYQECYWGSFSRSVILPQEVDADKTEASVKNGLLRIVMPKLSRQKAKKVKIKLD